MFKKVILTLCVLASLSFTNCIFSNFSNSKGIEYSNSELNSTENWVLEFHDDRWWWVLYDTDGNRILEIPVDF